MNDRPHLLRLGLYALCLALAVFHFSQNIADPDLWGHTLFGLRMLHSQTLEAVDPFSWTALGQPWINHEVGAELAFGAAYKTLGGGGLLLLKFIIGMLTFWIALRTGIRGLAPPAAAAGWALGLLASGEIAFGFAVRPQIFTALFLACLLAVLQAIHAGRLNRVWVLPPLFALWINVHGGALAGFCLLGAATAASTLQTLCARHLKDPTARRRTILLWLGLCLCAAALLCNPWGWKLPLWLVQSVRWNRPIIDEWNPTPLGWDHAPFFALLPVVLFAWTVSRREKKLWEIVVLALLAAAGLRYVRHTPLFSLAALALTPPHLADALARCQGRFTNLMALFERPAVRNLAGAALFAAAAAVLISSVTLRKTHPFTMEVPRDTYPVNAVGFVQDHGITGNLLVFFDWGEMCIWELPRCRVSIDGRLDTCYPRPLIDAHWKFYNGETPAETSGLDLRQADLAILPPNLAGTAWLSRQPGWKVAYYDKLAAVLVRDVQRFSALQSKPLPAVGTDLAITGREPFPASMPHEASRDEPARQSQPIQDSEPSPSQPLSD